MLEGTRVCASRERVIAASLNTDSQSGKVGGESRQGRQMREIAHKSAYHAYYSRMTPLFRGKNPKHSTSVAVIPKPRLCPYCAHGTTSPSVTLTHAVSSPTGWVTKGEVMSCPACGMAIRAIRDNIRVVAVEFVCPRCGNHEDLEYRISKVSKSDRGKDGYEFEAQISCKTCVKERTIREFTKSISGVSQINVNPDSIEFKGG